MRSSLLSLATCLSIAAAQVHRGFNYGAVSRDGQTKDEAAFTAEFNAAKGLAGTDGAFSSARLYTMIQDGTTNDPISAIPAAIATNTRLFLGLWASAPQSHIDNEIAAFLKAVALYGDAFTGLINALSMGSEDLYRISKKGLENDPLAVGAQPDQLVSYIRQLKKAVADAGLSIKVGHSDTYDAWRNTTSAPVIPECDFLGMNTFPYFQTEDGNSIENAPKLFDNALDIMKGVSGGKEIIITETGWPVGGPVSVLAVPSPDNARSYYEAVGCNKLFGSIETYWYTLVDANTAMDKQPHFGVVGTTLSTTPLFDLSCKDTNTTSSTTPSASASPTRAGNGKPTGPVSYPVPNGNNTVPVGTAGAYGPVPTGPSTDPNVATGAASQMKAGALVALFAAAAAFVLV